MDKKANVCMEFCRANRISSRVFKKKPIRSLYGGGVSLPSRGKYYRNVSLSALDYLLKQGESICAGRTEGGIGITAVPDRLAMCPLRRGHILQIEFAVCAVADECVEQDIPLSIQ
jgi:hypothetical protein